MKVFSGIELEDIAELKYEVAVSSSELSGNGTSATLKLDDKDVEKSDDGLTYTWTIEDALVGETLSFVESGYEHSDYDFDGADPATEVALLVEEDGENEVQITNSYIKKETLTITKTVTGIVVETDRSFTFTVNLFDENGNHLSGKYPITGAVNGEVVDGVAQIKLCHGQSITISGLSVGTSWTVSEIPSEGYTVRTGNTAGTIGRGGCTSTWVNEKIITGMPGVWINIGECFE